MLWGMMIVSRLKITVPLMASLLLGGCLGGLSPFSEKTDYTIAGVTADEDLDFYLHKILEDRLEEQLEESDDPEADARRETYREQMIRGDLVKAMHAKGYYEGEVIYEDHPDTALSGQYRVEPGPLYTIAKLSVEPKEFAGLIESDTVKVGAVLDAAAVLAHQQNLSKAVQKDHCYFSLNVKNAVVLDKKSHTGSLVYTVDAAAEGNFGSLIFSGHQTVKLSYLDQLVTWKEGDCYRQEKIESLRARLLETGLFVKADVILPDAPDADGLVPVEIVLQERAHRTLRAGSSYYTDEGVGVTLGWEHRNYFGAAEKLSASLNLSSLKQSFDVNLLKPFFLRKDQSLSLNTSLRRQDTDAFEEFGLDLGGNVIRKFNNRLSGSTGVGLTLTEITEDNNVNDESILYGLVSFPNSLTFDNRNDKLDPHRGWLLTAAMTPFVDVLGESDPFFKMQFGASTYLSFDEDHKYILALRAAYGSILGSGQFDIPSTERFYAGGGGSVRGYGYQEVGPKDSDGDPLGGRSMVTGSAELRLKFTDTIGGVAFVDAGSVSEESFAKMDALAVGAGVGLRYYTSFGPLRFDIATPLTQKDDLEQSYQFYISIGQAF